LGSINKNRFFPSIIYFFFGEYFSDALRNTLTIILPIVIFFLLGQREPGIGIGVGALLVSLTDFPDNKLNKFKTAVYGLAIFFLTTVLMSAALSSFLLTATVMVTAAFVFSMIAVYGNRMAVIGTMGIVVCTFVMGMQPKHPFLFSVYMLIGGTWYYLNSLLQIWIFPYRSLHHAVFECLMSSALFLKAKAKNYDPSEAFDPSQKEIIHLHAKVNGKHELIRNLLLTDKLAMDPRNKKGQQLLGRTFLLIDLYELLNAVHYDYALVRKTFADDKTLFEMKKVIDYLALELEKLAGEMRLGLFGRKANPLKSDDEHFKTQLSVNSTDKDSVSRDILNAFNANTKAVGEIIFMLRNNHYVQDNRSLPFDVAFDYKRFIPDSGSTIWRNLTFDSSTFRFSLRLAVCFLFGFLLISQMNLSRYSYWLFLTIVIVARPKFTITWKRNLQRISGSMSGIIIGFTIVYFIQSPAVLLSFAVICLLGFFSFNRLSYALSVVFITLAVVLTLSVYHGHLDLIIKDRILFTILGCLIAVFAAYLFPIWDSRQLKDKLNAAVLGTINYLEQITAQKNHESESVRLARKEANLTLAALSEALDSAGQEPLRKTMRLNLFYRKQVLLYRINALLTSVLISSELIDSHTQAQIKLNLSDFDNTKSISYKDDNQIAGGKKTDQILALSQTFASLSN